MTRRTSPSPGNFPALAAFLSGYLHEDFTLDYRTPDGARRAFEKDATGKERRELRNDARRFADETKGWTWSRRRAAYIRLGGAWLPESAAELSAFLESLGSTTT